MGYRYRVYYLGATSSGISNHGLGTHFRNRKRNSCVFTKEELEEKRHY